jgi:hypothetical protein
MDFKDSLNHIIMCAKFRFFVEIKLLAFIIVDPASKQKILLETWDISMGEFTLEHLCAQTYTL